MSISDHGGPVRVKLVTIMAASELWDRLEADLRSLGVHGYTFMSANGRGARGLRQGGWLLAGNIRIETLVTPEKAKAIFDRLLGEYRSDEVAAYVHDVEAIGHT